MINPIEAAVAPLKNDAMDAAEKYARQLVERIGKDLEAADWNMETAAPYPNGNMSRPQYMTMINKRRLFDRVTTSDEKRMKGIIRRPGAPHFVVVDSASVERFVVEARKDAAAQYDAFVAKLTFKIGDCSAAVLEGNHVWGCSYLTVTKASGNEVWKTQSIINVSKLNKVFNQWPTRKMKGGAR